MPIVARVLSFVLAAGVLASCDRLTRLLNSDLEFAYVGDDAGSVERASVSIDTVVIASARRVAMRATADPSVNELDVEETHYVRGTLTIVYTGRLVFRCRREEAWCQRVTAAPTSGTRPRDVFRKWPARIGAIREGYPM